MEDWNGKPIKIGDYVRHVYEPTPPNKNAPHGRGYHNHEFAGAAKVIEIVNETCVRIEPGNKCIPVFLGALLEVVPSREHAVMVSYIVPLDGSYMEPGEQTRAKEPA